MVSVSLVLIRTAVATSIIKSSAAFFRKSCHQHFGGRYNCGIRAKVLRAAMSY